MSRSRLVARVLAFCLLARSLAAQPPRESEAPRAATVLAALSVNALLGGATAAVRARLGHRDAARAFARGAAGGAVHFGGKYAASQPGSLSGPVGVAIGSTGTAMVSNAGRGAPLLDELFLPVGPLRVRLARPEAGARRRVRLTLNAFEGVMLARTFARSGLRVDWERSASAGAFVFVAPHHEIVSDGRIVGGVELGAVAVVGGLTSRLAPIVRHEAAHVQQEYFAQEVWVRPTEAWLRRRVRPLRWVPEWIEPGVSVLPVWAIDDALDDPYGPAARLVESEAYLLGRE